MNEWYELTNMTKGAPITIEKVRVAPKGIVLEGEFELPPLARLTMEDQIFVIAFLRSHGSIKEMEEMFGISYPTVKNRINRIARQIQFVEIMSVSPQEEVIAELERGDISAEEAIRRLSK